MEAYQPIYDAVRSRIGNGDIGESIEQAMRDANISHHAEMAANAVQCAAAEYERPSVVFRPKVFIDGNQWCALYGDNLQDGVAGFGDTPDKAMRNFDLNWCEQKVGAGETAIADAQSIEAAHAMGASGGPAVEAERFAFEAWMRGHCWSLCATWNGSEYKSDSENDGWPDPQAMRTRQMWAVWRDRAALTHNALAQADAACGVSPGAMGSASNLRRTK